MSSRSVKPAANAPSRLPRRAWHADRLVQVRVGAAGRSPGESGRPGLIRQVRWVLTGAAPLPETLRGGGCARWVSLWVPVTLSQSLTWSLALHVGTGKFGIRLRGSRAVRHFQCS
jgi:hypothetical protein